MLLYTHIQQLTTNLADIFWSLLNNVFFIIFTARTLSINIIFYRNLASRAHTYSLIVIIVLNVLSTACGILNSSRSKFHLIKLKLN